MIDLKYHIITYGCQMNKNDSERVAAVMERLGFVEHPKPEGSDCIIVNTCSVRQTAEDRVFGHMRNFEDLKRENPKLILAVTGCMPGRDHDGKLRKKLPMVDLFFPILDLPQLPRWLSELRPEIANSLDLADDYFKIQPARKSAYQGFVSISFGCNNFCTFCVVPYSRGREKSRSVTDILSEIRDYTAHGCLEITLLGQNVNTYKPSDLDTFSPNNPFRSRGDRTSFAALLWEVNQISGIERVHFTAPNPQDMTDAVIEALALPKQVNYVHLPVQAGSNRVLKKMNRRYTREQYFDSIEKIRRIRPTIAIGTDIIVGFCTETEAEFQETLDLYKRVDFDIAYTAMYSSRSGTAAGRFWKDNVSRDEKKRRWHVLQQLMEETVLRKNQAYVGKTVEVFVDEYQQQGNFCLGNSREMKRVQFRGDPSFVGQIVPVKIVKAMEWLLVGNHITRST